MNISKMMFAGLMAVTMSFTGCKTEVQPETASNEFQIESSIEAMTRTPQLDGNGAGKFVAGDQNTLFFHQDAQSLFTFNYEYGKTCYWDAIKVPAETGSCSLSACYPVVTVSDPAGYSWDVRSHAENPDFLFAAPVNVKINSASPVSLNFTHALHRLVVELVPDGISMTEDMMAQSRIEVRNFLPVAQLDLLRAQAVSAAGELSSQSTSARKAAFILPAQPAGQMEIVVSVDNRTAVYPLSSCEVSGQPLKELAAGKTFSLTIKVSQHAFTITGQEIAGWENQGRFEGSVIL